MSEREYAARVGLSRGAIQKAKAAGRLVLLADGTIDAEGSDARRAAMTDPAKQRSKSNVTPAAAPKARMKPVSDTALSAVGDTLREHGLATPATGGGTTFLQAKTANEVLNAQERKLKLAKLKGELVDRSRAEALMFRLAREERDAWVNWSARAAALMASELAAAMGGDAVVEVSLIRKVLETHVRAQLDSLAEVRPDLG